MDKSVVALGSVTAVYEGERTATLYDVTLSVAAGELLAIVGPNGSGKTTLLEVVNGLLPIAAGSVRVFGEAVDVGSHRVRARIAYVPQDLFFPPETPFLVRDVVMAARFAQIGAMRLPSRSDRARVGNALAAVRISSLSGRPIGRLSGGSSVRRSWPEPLRRVPDFSFSMNRRPTSIRRRRAKSPGWSWRSSAS